MKFLSASSENTLYNTKRFIGEWYVQIVLIILQSRYSFKRLICYSYEDPLIRSDSQLYPYHVVAGTQRHKE